jgi:predicted phosphoribosyltransferase
MTFRDRRQAGRALAEKLQHYAGSDDVLEIARALGAPLEVFLVRKLGVPGHGEFAMGAIAAGGVTVLNEALILELGITQRAVSEAIAREQKELERRERLYRAGWPAPRVRGRTAILVDDGLATGATMRAAAARRDFALLALRGRGFTCARFFSRALDGAFFGHGVSFRRGLSAHPWRGPAL